MGVFDGRTVLVTGATGNMGQEVCARLVAEGARVWALDRTEAAVAGLAAKLGAQVAGGACDLGDAAAVDRAFDAAGPVWGVVHTVGGWRGGGLAQGTPEDLAAMLDLNVRTAFLVTRAALVRMVANGGGRIVTVGSINAAQGIGLAGAAAYNVSKAAVIALAKAADEEGRGANVRACCLAPTTLDTPLNRKSMPEADPTRWVALGEVASAALACLRPDSGLGGAVLPLPGR